MKGEKHMRQKPGTLLFVKWLDAFSIDDWTHADDAKIVPCEIHSAGICIEHTVSHLTLALNHDTFNQNYSCLMTIPTGMITHIKRLK